MANTRAKTKKARKADFDLKTTQSATLIGSNDDLLTEILLRLPVTSILRFKSVSKHWRWLLSHTHFTHRYDKLSKSLGIFVRNAYVPFDVENPTTPPFDRLNSYFEPFTGVGILQSCNGLLLCCANKGRNGRKTYGRYYVFNPTTKQLALIPPVPGGLIGRKAIRFMGLAYHETDCMHYKVVCIRRVKRNGGLYQILTYSSNTREWNVSIESFSASTSVFHQGVYWNGAVYWAPYCYNNDYVYFKIDDEQLQTLPLPVDLMSSKISAMYLGESRGHLHLIVYGNREDSSSPLNVYEMLNDRSGWFVKYQLLGAFPDMISEYGYDFRVIDVVRGDEEEEEDTFIVLRIPGKILTYNVHDKSFKQILSFTFRRYTYVGSSSFHRYTETLSSF